MLIDITDRNNDFWQFAVDKKRIVSRFTAWFHKTRFV